MPGMLSAVGVYWNYATPKPMNRRLLETANSKKGYARFQVALLDAMKDDLLPKGMKGKEGKELGVAIHNHLFNLPGPKQVSTKRTDREIYLGRVFYGFAEISKSLETLEDIQFYIGRFPYHKTNITRGRYLQFNVEAFLHEMYLLEQRLIRQIRFFERQFRNDSRGKRVAGISQNLSEGIRKAFAQTVELRRVHVHEQRISDADISRLGTMELLTANSKGEWVDALRLYYRGEYKRIKKRWKKMIGDSNDSVRKTLDFYFDVLFPIVFDKQAGVRYPTELRITERKRS
jgi:hypothetical protein